MRNWGALAGSVLAVLPLVITLPGTASAVPHESEPIYSYAVAIRETVWVDTGADVDRDGRADRVTADIIRSAEPAARGERVPVIMDTAQPRCATTSAMAPASGR